ncbi:ADAMTS-like protein 5 isoform X4 [Lutra lutra]|uniref:ADAMTS-like protein 5 isoform X4 n=1 Tax=Lutra lutra TaxID=9657 RepID=UPI001FD3808F|nr:ADAMTS-like protein 5 isoform X4 [Lutra lutra]
MSLREGWGEDQGRGVPAGKGDPRGEAIWASVERRQPLGLPEPWQGHLGSHTFPGPERGARNSSSGVGGRGGQFPHGSPALGFPRSPGYGRWNTRPQFRGTGPRAGQSPAVDPRRGAQRPRGGARGYRPLGPQPGRALGSRVGGAAPGSPPPPAPGSPRPSPRAPPLPLVLGPPREPGCAAWALRSRDENRGPERLNYCPKSHSQLGQSRGSDPGLLAPPRQRPRCPPTPRPLQNLLLLWTFLNCGLGGGAQGPGEWTPWGSWSRCSSSCGRGLSVRSRRCVWFPGEEPCWGDSHEYRLCRLPAIPFRDLQCAVYNGHPVLGSQKTYQWVPFYGGAFAGYWNVTLIPEGARHIRVAHRSRNHLALMGGDGRYVLNGNWAVSPPGTYDAAGTRVVYTREAGPEEMLSAAGPTSQDLLLQVLLQEPNPGIEFEFWLPRERYSPFQAQAQALGWSLRQQQPQEVDGQPSKLPAAPATTVPRIPTPAPDPCSPCPDTRGRAHRLLHYCGSDFVFRARVLSRQHQAQETRYEVQVRLIYKNRSPLRALEYVWALGRCPCPRLDLHREYLLAAQRLISPDGTQDRLLLPHTGYARSWSPAEDSRVRLAARHCPS